MEKIDPKKLYKSAYNPKKQYEFIEIPKLQFLSIKGQGNPNNSVEYADCVGALFSLSYGLKFHSKKKHQKDYVVGPLEGLWWADDMNDFISRNKEKWKWEMLIWQPDWIEMGDFNLTLEQTKNKNPNRKLEEVELKTIDEGLCVQILHIGSYDDEAPVLAKMHDEFIPQNGFKMRGLHHEIYLSDPRKTAPEKLKTILRQPVLKV